MEKKIDSQRSALARHSSKIVLSFIFLSVLTSVVGWASEVVTRDELTNKQRALWYYKIYSRTVSGQDYKDIQRFVEKAKDPRERIDGLVVMSRLQRVSLGNCEAALQILWPLALSAETFRQQAGKNNKIQSDPLSGGAPSCQEKWSNHDISLPAILEVARVFAATGKQEESRAVLKECKDRPSLSQANQALVAYAAGDCLMEMERFDEAVEMYSFAQRAISDLEKPYDQLTDELRIIRDSLRVAMDAAKAKADTEKYGPEYILYRQADWLRRFKNQPVMAYANFQKVIRDFPGTIYAEASAAYSIECLCDCASGLKGDLVGAVLKDSTKRVEEMTNSLIDMAKIGSANEIRERQSKLIDEQRAMMEVMQVIPELKGKSESLIVKKANEFISSKPLGVYRGEVMIALGNYYFEGENKLSESLAWYTKAISWYGDIARGGGVLDEFIVDSRIKEVSAPPLTMKSKDEWGNVSRNNVAAGDLINHMTCEWYSSQQILDAEVKVAAIKFIEGKIESAVLNLNAILKFDLEERRLHEMGLPNSYDRLVNGMRSGRLNATDTELNLFKNEAKFALIAAEIAYEMEDWEEAARLYAAVSLKYGDGLAKDAQSYLRFMRGSTLLMTGNEKEAVKEFQAVAEDQKCPTYPRAMWCLFNLSQFDRGRDSESISYLDKVIQRTQGSSYVQDFTYTKAEFLFLRNQIAESRILFTWLCKQKNCKPWMLMACKDYIEKIEAALVPTTAPPIGQ